MRKTGTTDKPHHIKWIEAERALALNAWSSSYFPNQVSTPPHNKARYQ